MSARAGHASAGAGRLALQLLQLRTPISPANSLSSCASTTPDPSGSMAMNMSSSDIPVMTSFSLPAFGDVFRLARERGVDGSEERGDSMPSPSSGFANVTWLSSDFRFREWDIAPDPTPTPSQHRGGESPPPPSPERAGLEAGALPRLCPPNAAQCGLVGRELGFHEPKHPAQHRVPAAAPGRRRALGV